MSSPALVEAASLQVRYHARKQWVPRHPQSLELQPGRTTLLVGPSGCGKSTLTLTLNGLVPHSVPSDYRGSVLVAGAEVADAPLSELAARTAMVMQDPDTQIVTDSVWGEVCYALQNVRLPREEIVERAKAALDALDLTHLATTDPWLLSGGQRQRVLLAAALAQRPQLLVLDEPTANLDPAAAQQFYAHLPALKEAGTAILIVEHNLDHLIGAVDQVIALAKNGQVLATGTPAQVFGAHAALLEEAGIRLPTATRVGLRLGITPLPLTLADVAAPPSAQQPPLEEGGTGGAAPLRAGAKVTAGATSSTPQLAAPAAGGVEPKVGATSSTPGVATVEARGLSVTLGGAAVLADVDFAAYPGEILAVLGVNGSGKSTLLRALVGLQRFQAESFAFEGRPIRRPRVHPLATLVTQNPEHQFVRHTVRAELAHSLRLARRPEAEIGERVAALMAEFGLVELAEVHPFTLSGGEKRRLSVAAALALPRKVLYLDEPTFGQDARNAERLMAHMRTLANQGTAVVLASHDLELVAQHSDRVLLLRDGRVAATGQTRQVLTDTATLASAGLPATELTRVGAALRAGGLLGGEHGGDSAWLTWRDVPARAGSPAQERARAQAAEPEQGRVPAREGCK